MMSLKLDIKAEEKNYHNADDLKFSFHKTLL